MQRVAITGPTGMIGSALIDFLTAKNTEVLAITNPNSDRSRNLPENDPYVTVLPCAMDEYADFAEGPIARKMPRCDVFYHFAWAGTTGPGRNDEVRQLRNVSCAQDAVRLAAALGCKRFVFAGSQAQYGPLDVKFGPDTPTNPVNAYGRGKLQAEERTRELCAELGIEHIACRIGSVYGPLDWSGSVLIQSLFHAWHDEPFACTPGEQEWDYIFCDDAADALWRMGAKGVPGSIYCLGSGKTAPLKEYISMACQVANPDFMPDFGGIEYPANQPMYLCADIANLTEDTGFIPLMEFPDGIRRTAEWYREELTVTPEQSWEKHYGLDD